MNAHHTSAGSPHGSPHVNTHGSPYFQIPTQQRHTAAGRADLPIFYYDSTAAFAVFLADADLAQPLLADKSLQLGLRMGRKVPVFVAMFEYRHTAIGPYNEVGVALPVHRQGSARSSWADMLDMLKRGDLRELATYIIDLPVTTPLAFAAGTEYWGFPKFVTPIDFSLRGGHLACTVQDPNGGAPIMSLTGRGLPLMPAPALDLTLMSYLGQQRLRSLADSLGSTVLRTGFGFKLDVGASEHPMARRLRQLKLHGQRPLCILTAAKSQMRLHAGVEV